MAAPSSPVTSLLSAPQYFRDADWASVPDTAGVYVIYDESEVIYVGMAGRDGSGSLRRRLRDHASGQIVNMFAQYLFLDRVQFACEERIRHPQQAKAAVHAYVRERCRLSFAPTPDGISARQMEQLLKQELRPTLNPK